MSAQNTTTPKPPKIWNILGTLLSVTLIIGILYQLSTNQSLKTLNQFSYQQYLWMMFSVGFYVFAVFCGTIAWHLIFLCHSSKPISLTHDMSIFFFTQINKYLPANIFHYVGRFIYLRNAGYEQSEITVASLHEIATLVGTASLLSIPIVVQNTSRLPLPNFFVLTVILCTGLALIALLVVFSGRFRQKLKQLLIIVQGNPRVLVKVLIVYLINFLSLGIALWFLVFSLDKSARFDPIYFSSVFAGAWTLGLIMPGASAGIGVRETALIVLLSAYLTSEDALLVSIMMRTVSIIGDIVIWGAGFLLMHNYSRKFRY